MAKKKKQTEAEDTNVGNINMNNNVAVSGLDMDSSLNQVVKGKLTYALNAAVENFDSTAINYQNEPGNELCVSFPTDFVLIGNHYIQEKSKHIFFLSNPITEESEIGYMDNNDCQYQTLINANCLNFNIKYPVHKMVHKITNCTTEIYWTDGFNPRRYLDITNIPYTLKITADPCNPEKTDQLDCNQLKVQPDFTIPQVSIVDVISGGNLVAGTYQFAVQYSDAVGNGYTTFYSVTNPCAISNPFVTDFNFNYAVSNSIVVNISDIDTTGQYSYYNLAVIKTINSSRSVFLVGTYSIENNSRTVTYTGEDVTAIALNIEDIIEKFPYYEIADDITAVQDVLVWKGLTSIDRINYQAIASQIALQWQTYKLPTNENYSNSFNTANLRGYLRDEVYAFEIVFLLKNGKQTDGFHIPGRVKNANEGYPDVPNTNPDFIGEGTSAPYWSIYNTASVLGPATGDSIGNATPYQYGEFAYWESTELYPCNEPVWGELINQPIRHHKFPDILVSPAFESATPTIDSNGKYIVTPQLNNSIYPIGVKVNSEQIEALINVSTLTASQKDDIVGFKIIRGDRGTNKSIVAKGILRNVGKYTRNNQSYYYPNYPYNDISDDPFLLEENNSYTVLGQNIGWMVQCRETDPTTNVCTYQYVDPITGKTVIEDLVLGQTVEVCSLIRPIFLSGQALIGPSEYDCVQTNADSNAGQYDIAYIHSTYSIENEDGTEVSSNVGDWFSKVAIDAKASLSNGDPVNTYSFEWELCEVGQWPQSQTTSGGTVIPGKKFGRRSKLSCISDDPLNISNEESAKYRQVFNSPETSFGQPFLGDILKLENVMYGAGKAHHVEVKDNAKYRLLSKEAQEDALAKSYEIAGITNPFNLVALFTAYQTYLQIYINGILRKNYAYSYNSIADYGYSADILNAGNKQRELEISQYIIPVVQSLGDDFGINNYQRETSIYLKTKEDIVALPFPSQTSSLLLGVNSYIEDNSKKTISDFDNCNSPEKEKDINVVSYYASLKNIIVNQWGQIYSYTTVDTGAQQIFNSAEYKSDFTAFGGDTFISRFAFKTKLPFFNDNTVRSANDAEIYYDELGNIGYPKYWHSARSILYNYSQGDGPEFKNLISVKAHNFDCPNDPSLIPAGRDGVAGTYRTFYDGYFYLFAYGIPNFYCESSYNTDLRQAFNNREGDFWPHVSTGIPDDWVQESFVSIAFDNTYHYNPTYSKQNKENFFSHLPEDWEEKLCFTQYPFRAIYSDTQENNADVRFNNWLLYKPLALFDFPQNFGNFTSIDGIQNKAILARFENKTLMYNKLLTINTSNPQAAYLGNPDMFGNPPIDFAETDLGYVGSQNKFLLKIPQGQISIDAKRGQIFLITDQGAEDLTAYGSGVNRFMTDHLAFEILRYYPTIPIDNHFNGIGLHGVYDSKFDRVIFTKIDYIPVSNDIKYNSTTDTFYVEQTINDIVFTTEVYLTDVDFFCNKSWTISFNFNTKSWISFHSYIPNWYIGDNNFFYSGINGCCTDIDVDSFTAIVGDLNRVPTTTTTSTRITTSSTTTVNPVKPVECDIEANAIITYCELEATAYITVPSVPTTTICVRPTGLDGYIFVTGYQILADPAVDSTVSLEAACAAMSITRTPLSNPDVVLSTVDVSALLLSVNTPVYTGFESYVTSCTFVDDGWYYIVGDTSVSPENVYHIEGGVITEVTTCDCGITPEPTEPVYNVPECCGILLTDGNDVYYYDGNMNLLDVPGFTTTYGIAITSHYLWSVTTAFLQWDITLAPFTAVYNTSIPFPGGFTTSSGIVAINDDTLVGVDDSVSPPNVVELTIDNLALPTFVTPVTQFALQTDRVASGNMLYTNDGKLIIINQDTVSTDYYLTQYDYATGTIELDLVLSVIPTSIYQCDCTIFITVGATLYAIEKTSPNSIIEVTTISPTPISAAQIATCVGSTLIEATTTTTTTIAPTTTTTTTL
tara:strand:- start:33160 stop:39018 length:5859 start_codon:yes stop_codon:yes gene_type:complete